MEFRCNQYNIGMFAMILIKKLSRRMSLMLIKDRRLIEPVILIVFCSAKLLLKGVYVVHFIKRPHHC